MASKPVMDFYAKVVADPALQERLKLALDDVPAGATSAMVAAVVRLAREAGHTLEAREVEAALDEAAAVPRGPQPLTADELDAVVGGAGSGAPSPTAQAYASAPRIPGLERLTGF
jgi:hypothetical protein